MKGFLLTTAITAFSTLWLYFYDRPYSHYEFVASGKEIESAISVPLEIGFGLNGQFHPAKSNIDVLEKFFEELTKRDSTFPERFAALPKHGSKRRYFDKNKDNLYPKESNYARDVENHSRKLQSGYWMATNLSTERINKIIQMACDVAGLEFGRDVTVNLGD